MVAEKVHSMKTVDNFMTWIFCFILEMKFLNIHFQKVMQNIRSLNALIFYIEANIDRIRYNKINAHIYDIIKT